MRILFIGSNFIYPPYKGGGGKIRGYYLLRELARRHRVWFFGFANADDISKYILHLKQFCGHVELYPFKKALPRQNRLKRILRLFPYGELRDPRFVSRDMERSLRQVLEKGKFDVAVFEHYMLAHFWRPLKGLVPLVLINQNIEYQIVKEKFQLQNWGLKMRLQGHLEEAKVKRYESWIYRHFDRILACSELEASRVRGLVPGAKVFVVPSGVDLERFRPGLSDEHCKGEAIVHTGALTWEFNLDAVSYFIKDIFPAIKRVHPGAKFYVVGHSSENGELEKLWGKNTSIIFTGLVEDERPYFEKSQVFVVPLRRGSGTRLKILSALAMEKAVVSTSLGAEGLGLTHTQNVLIADDPLDFAEAVNGLLEDEVRRKALGKAGRAFVEENYDWRKIGDSLDRALRDLVSASTGRR